MRAQIRRIARSLAISSKKSSPEAVKNAMRGANASTSTPRASSPSMCCAATIIAKAAS